MRFGIMSTQMKLLIPPDLPANGLLEHIATYSHSDLVKTIAANGFSLIELGGDLELVLPHLYTPENIQALVKLKSDLGLQYTIHLPLWSVEPSTMLAPIRNGSVEALVSHIQLVKPLGPEVYVLHATGALAAEFYRMKIPHHAKDFILEQFINCAKTSVRRILDETGIPNRKLAVETIEFPFDLTLDLAEELDVSICFDTGHVLVGFSGPIDFFDALDRCMPRLAEIHLHDSPSHSIAKGIAYGKDHQSLGNGVLEIDAFFDHLDKAAYSGPIIFELSLEQALKSLDMIRHIRPDVLGNH
jgi:sugar phosphate isomerase/epimerase